MLDQQTIKPALFLALNLSNRASKTKQEFFSVGNVPTKEPAKIIEQFCDDTINCYIMNEIGERRLFYPGILEPKPQFQIRSAQGIINLVVSHFEAMKIDEDKKVLIMVAHHN